MAKVVVLKIYRSGELVAEKQLNQDHIVLGSSAEEAHVTLPGDASPIHASIEKRGDKYILCDVGSEKGTFKNQDKILEAEIVSGDKIGAGEFTIEFYLQEGPEESVATSSAQVERRSFPDEVTQPINLEQPVAVSAAAAASAGGSLQSVSSSVSGFKNATFSPKSSHSDVGEIVRPTKGTLVEVLVAWQERVISVYHFSEAGTIMVGTHPSCDVMVPLLAAGVDRAPLIQLNQQVQIILHPGMQGTLVTEGGAVPFNQLASMGRGSGQFVNLQQGEMARLQMGEGVEVIVRYSSQAPKPVVIPFIDLSSNGFLAVLLAIVLTGILSLYVALNKLDKLDKDNEDEYRTALIITNPPKPPPQVKLPPPKIEKKQVKKIVKKPPPPKKVKKIKVDMKKKEPKKVTRTTVKKKKGGGAGGGRAKGSANDKTAKSMRPKEGKKTNQVTSVKQGGSVKTAKKEGAQMQSERKLKNSGIFSAFGSGGRNDRIDQSYSGSGELAGLADQATGTAGFGEDRPGNGLGSKFKDTGAGGTGKSNVGVSGISKGTGLGAGGFGESGLGDRKAVSIIPGGGGEEFSGQIDKEGIRKVFFDNARAIRSCYERELIRNPNLTGKLMLNFDIGEHGRVVGSPKINWGDSTMKSRDVASCVLGRLRTWRFPEPPRNNVVNVIYPLAFAAK
ncbi:MAG: AgmX/PglI C-terminal domain-containing protein [Bdellovibrionales bacterium]|nr:AgmX/PglI C-terminal domain-containing protein [Bdellovibrionales bacterium]